MILLDVPQGSPEWFKARSDIPTGSCFGRILTPGGQRSEQWGKYIDDLCADWLMGKPDPDDFSGYWMDRGTRLEPDARALYSFMHNVRVEQVGFAYLDVLRRIGVSPDGLVGQEGGLEVKCPKKGTHVRNLRKQVMPGVYIPQVQGCMWICERKWWDFMSFHPEMKPMIIRVMRDNKYIAKLEAAANDFLSDLSDQKQQMEEYK